MDAEKKKALVELFQEILDRDLYLSISISTHFSKENYINGKDEAYKLAKKISEILNSDISISNDSKYVDERLTISDNWYNRFDISYGKW